MNRNETTTPSVNLSPLMGLSVLILLGVIAGLVMLYGLHNKIQKPATVEAAVAVDEIGQIELDEGLVRINLMTRTATGGLEKFQEVSLPLEKFASGYPRIKAFMDQLIEKEIITQQE